MILTQSMRFSTVEVAGNQLIFDAQEHKFYEFPGAGAPEKRSKSSGGGAKRNTAQPASRESEKRAVIDRIVKKGKAGEGAAGVHVDKGGGRRCVRCGEVKKFVRQGGMCKECRESGE